MGDSHVGLQARLMSQALRKLTGGLNQTNTTMIFINQLREKIGVFFGSPETTAGGKALKFYASVRLDIRRIETLKDGTDAVGTVPASRSSRTRWRRRSSRPSSTSSTASASPARAPSSTTASSRAS
jgi:protein RecA